MERVLAIRLGKLAEVDPRTIGPYSITDPISARDSIFDAHFHTFFDIVWFKTIERIEALPTPRSDPFELMFAELDRLWAFGGLDDEARLGDPSDRSVQSGRGNIGIQTQGQSNR